ncbi:hypothetical protein ACJMK2_006103 [Sinanodonta woodiana]|uniref:IRS-type PTB domain-containing protein n=1 Tax=Sinanodonta woodiana TaxID=1069815 RepID=A0ABD3VS44_SINWO
MIIECVHCCFKIDDSCKFCHQCGNPPQSNICSKCRAQCSEDFKFCPQCGTPVSITARPSRQATSSYFDVTIEENDAAKRCHLKGNYIIHVSATAIDLLDSRQNVVYSWPCAYVRRYGVENNKTVLIIEVGRKSDSGEGQFKFQTCKAQEINDLIHWHFTQSHYRIPTVDTILQQEVDNRHGSFISDESRRSIQLPSREQSAFSTSTTDGVENSLEAMRDWFDITIEENESAKRCHLKGNYIIHVSARCIDLLDSRHNLIYRWPGSYIRRYGIECNQNVLIIEVGRKSDSGEGQFRFRSRKAQEIHDLIQCRFAQDVAIRQGSSTSEKSERSIPLPKELQTKVSYPTTNDTDNSLAATSPYFDITIDENDAAKRCHLKGNYIIHVSATGIDLLDSRHSLVYSWPREYIRRYGVDSTKDMLIIDVGRRSDSGEGQFRFQTRKAQEINALIHCHFTKLQESHHPIPTVAPILAQDVAIRQGSSSSDESERSILLPKILQSKISSPTSNDTDNSLAGNPLPPQPPEDIPPSPITACNTQQIYSEPIKPDESGDPLVLPEASRFRQAALKTGVEKIHKDDYIHVKSPPLPPGPSNSNDDDGTYVGLYCFYNELKFEKMALKNWKLNSAKVTAQPQGILQPELKTRLRKGDGWRPG